MATFDFNCPQCGNLLSGEDEWRGMETQCSYYRNVIRRTDNFICRKNFPPVFRVLFFMAAVFICSSVMAADFNWDVMKNPPNKIKYASRGKENAFWIPKKIKALNVRAYHSIFYFYPRILLKNGKTVIQIIFCSEIGDLEKLSVESNNVLYDIALRKNDTFKRKNKFFYRTYGEMSVKQYVDCFVANTPTSVNCQIASVLDNYQGRKNNKYRLSFNKDWKHSFAAMAPLFKTASDEKDVFKNPELIIADAETRSFRLKLVKNAAGHETPFLYIYPIPDDVRQIALKMKSGEILYYNLPKINSFSGKSKHRGIISIRKNDFVNIFCNDTPLKVLLAPDSKDVKSIAFDQKTLQEFADIVKLWTENQLKNNHDTLSARNSKTPARVKNPRIKVNGAQDKDVGTFDAADSKYWNYMDKIFCSRNDIPYSLIDAAAPYRRRNVRERRKPYPSGMFYIK